MQKFCHNCGKKMPTVDAKFCPECGTSLASLTAKPPTTTPTPQTTASFTPFVVNGEDDDDYIDKIDKLDIKLDALQLEIVKDRRIDETVATVTAAGQMMPVAIDSRPSTQVKMTKKLKKQLVETIMKEGASIRPNETSHNATVT